MESDNFIADGLLDSFDIVTLVAALDEHYEISILGDDVTPENFRNVETLVRLLHRYAINHEC